MTVSYPDVSKPLRRCGYLCLLPALSRADGHAGVTRCTGTTSS